MKTFTRQQYSLYAPRKKAKKRRNNCKQMNIKRNKKANKKRKQKQTRKLHFVAFVLFFFCFVFTFCLLYFRCYCFVFAFCFCFCYACSFDFVLLFFRFVHTTNIFDGWSYMAAIAQHNSRISYKKHMIKLVIVGFRETIMSIFSTILSTSPLNRGLQKDHLA